MCVSHNFFKLISIIFGIFPSFRIVTDFYSENREKISKILKKKIKKKKINECFPDITVILSI